MSFFCDEDVSVHERGLDFLDDSHFSTSTSRILVDLLLYGDDGLFGIFLVFRLFSSLTRHFIDRIFEIGSEELFHESIFERVKADDHDESTWTKEGEGLRERLFYVEEFFIDCDTKSLKDSKWRLRIEARTFDECKEFLCGVNFCFFSRFYDSTGDKPGLLLLSIRCKNTSKLGCTQRHHEISSSTPSSPVVSHIEWPIESQRKSSNCLIEVDTTDSEIIEDDIDTIYTQEIQFFFQMRKTRMNIVFSDFWAYRL